MNQPSLLAKSRERPSLAQRRAMRMKTVPVRCPHLSQRASGLLQQQVPGHCAAQQPPRTALLPNCTFEIK